MNRKNKILWITRTAIFIALLIVLQAATAPLGNIIITGSIVNLMLIVSVMTCGLASGLSVAAVSPVMAKFFGIGPLWSLIPFIAAGNIALVLLWHFIGNRNIGRKHTAHVIALVCAAISKFLVLYIGIVKVAIPVFLGLPEQQAAVISNMFSIPQLITALVGGVAAVVLIPRLKQAIAGGTSKMDNTFTFSLYGIAALALGVSFMKDKKKTSLSLKRAWKMFINVLPQFISILLLIGLLLVIIKPETIQNIIGAESGFMGMIISSILGAIVFIPALIAFPIGAELLKNGAGVAQIVVFISTLTTVGFITLPLEVKYLGKKLTFIRNVLSYLFAFFVAYIMGAILT